MVIQKMKILKTIKNTFFIIFIGFNFIFSTNLYAFQPTQKTDKIVVFNRVKEPKENAFSILIPKGWRTDGGIFRVNPSAQGGPMQSIAAKLDFAVKKDRAGTVMFRWLPDMAYYDPRMSPAGQMGLIQPGSNYQGMSVHYLMSPQEYVSQIVIPYAHPNATNVQIVERRSLPKLAQKYQRRVAEYMHGMTLSYDAIIMTLTYYEGRINYKEKIVTMIENWGQMGAGIWANKETFLIRAPIKEFTQWQPIFSIVQNSVTLNMKWLQGEIKGQRTRSDIATRTHKEIQRIGRDIVKHRQETNAEIHNDMFLNLTDQEEFINPYTKQVEIGSNQWKHRWVNESGDTIYTDVKSYNPNIDANLKRSDFKKTPIRKRFPNR